MKKLVRFIAAVMIVVPMLALAHGPHRQLVEETIFIKAPPDKVWAIIKDFGGLDKWHPAVISSELKDEKTRVITLASENNPTITQQLLSSDDEDMTLVYKITDMSIVKTIKFNSVDTPYFTLPVSSYTSTFNVKAVNDGSEAKWQGQFYRSFMSPPPIPEGQSDQDAVDTIKAIYVSGLENLKTIMEK